MNIEKIYKAQDDIGEMLEKMTREELGKPAIVTYYKDLAKLHCALGQVAEDCMASQRGAAYRDGPEWGAYQDGMSGRRGRNMTTGRYVSYDSGYSERDPRETIRRVMDNPNMRYEAKENLRKAMESMR